MIRQAPPHRLVSLSLLPVSLVLAVVGILATFPMQDFDIFWHLANGRAMLEQGKIVNQEIFSFTANGKAFSNHAWLAQIVFYQIFKTLGPNGLIATKVLIATLIGLCLYLFGRSAGLAPIPASLLWLLAFNASLFRYVERPELFSLLFLSVNGALLLTYRSPMVSSKLLLLMPPLMVLWDFLHGALYGCIFLAAFLTGETLKYFLGAKLGEGSFPPLTKGRFQMLWLMVGVTVLLMLMSPYGLRSYEIFYEFMSNNRMASMTAEFQPTSLKEQPLFWLLLVGAVGVVFARGRRLDLTSLSLLIPFAAMAIRYVRGIGPFAIVAALLLAMHLPSMLSALASTPERQRRQEIIALILLFVGLGGSLGYKFSSATRYDSWGLGISDYGFPVGSTRFVKSANLTGNMYNTDRYGGYLAFYLFPERKIFHYNHHMLFDALERYVHEPETRSQWRINYAIIGRSDEWDMFSKDGFVPVYWEPSGAVMVKNTEENRAIIQRYAIRYFSPVMPKEEFAKLAKNPAILPVMAREVSDYLAERQDAEKVDVLVGLLFKTGAFPPQTAIELLTRAERYNAEVPRLAAALGTLFYQAGQIDQAEKHLNAALSKDEKLIEARFSLAFLRYDQRRYQEAVDLFQEILLLQPRHPDTIYGLGLALYQLGRHQEAIRSFQTYLELAPAGPWAEKARNFIAAPPVGS